MKHSPLTLRIPSPCHENWNEMTPSEQGRVCAHCRKEVVDFTHFTDNQLHTAFSGASTPLCGRFRASQLDRPISYTNLKPGKHFSVRVLASLMAVVAAGGEIQAQSAPRKPAQTEQLQQTSPEEPQPLCSVSGQVLDKKTKQPVGDASVEVYNIFTLQKYTTYTDEEGFFLIENLPDANHCYITVQKEGYASKEEPGKDLSRVDSFMFLLSKEVEKKRRQRYQESEIMGGIM